MRGPLRRAQQSWRLRRCVAKSRLRSQRRAPDGPYRRSDRSQYAECATIVSIMRDIHEASARHFIDLLKDRLGNKLHAVVLYGSVARGEAHADSDVDLLVVSDPPPVPKLIDEVAYDIDFAAQFTTFLAPIELSPEQMRDWLRRGDPFLERVLDEGKVLYDDGVIKDIRDRILASRA